jgi:hypothetical protein
MYKIMTSKLPFTGKNDELIENIKKANFEPIKDNNYDIKFINIIHSLLKKVYNLFLKLFYFFFI